MAIMATKLGTNLKLKYSLGVDGNGVEKFKTTTLKNLKIEASNEDLFALTNKIKEMQNNTLIEVSKVEDTKLSE